MKQGLSQKNGINQGELPLVSIVITTKNEERNIANCIKSIKTQTYPPEKIEIIVVDNQSQDQTKAIAKKYTPLVFDKGPERSAQRNHGMMEVAKGEYVMYVDADMIFSPCLIEDAVHEMEINPGLLALYISEIVLGTSFWSRVRRFERSFYDGTVVDCVRFIRKRTFSEVGGFDLSMTGPEDWDLDKKIRRKGTVKVLSQRKHPVARKAPMNAWEKEFSAFLDERGVDYTKWGSVIFHNEAEFDLPSYLRKKSYYTENFDIYVNKWGRTDADITKQLGFYYRFLGVFIEDGKWRKMVSHPIMAIGMYWLRFRVGMVFLKQKTKVFRRSIPLRERAPKE